MSVPRTSANAAMAYRRPNVILPANLPARPNFQALPRRPSHTRALHEPTLPISHQRAIQHAIEELRQRQDRLAEGLRGQVACRLAETRRQIAELDTAAAVEPSHLALEAVARSVAEYALSE